MRRWLDMAASRQLARRIALDAGMHALAGLVDFMPRMKQRMRNCRLIEDVEYARQGGQTLRLDILQPVGAAPHPVLIYFHGGGFAIGSKRTHRALAAAYASQGYLVCNVDYRLAPKHPFPAAIEDACAAWMWATDHVKDYGGDRARIGLAGESAGANLALAVTLACCTPRPESFAAPLFEGVCNPLWPCCTAAFCKPASLNVICVRGCPRWRQGLQPTRRAPTLVNIPKILMPNMRWPIRCVWSRR